MNAIRPRIIALICSCLLLSSVSSFAQTNNATTPAFPNTAARASYGKLAALWRRELGLPANPAEANAQEPAAVAFSNGAAASSVRNLRALFEQDMAFSLGQAGANGQQQTNPSSSNEPSLEGLGFPPSAVQGSAKEQALLNKRSHMLQIHQKLGLLTTIPLVATLFTGPGAKGHHGLPGSPTGRDLHAGLGILTTGLYFTSAYYAIRAPKIPGTKSYGLIRLHKALAWIHGPGMILTPILGEIAFSQLSNGEKVHGIAKYHAWAAYTTVAAYGVAILSVTLK
ncbi:MAG: hypothetical protein ACRD3T_13790 [Terriglobia bacterium]